MNPVDEHQTPENEIRHLIRSLLEADVGSGAEIYASLQALIRAEAPLSQNLGADEDANLHLWRLAVRSTDYAEFERRFRSPVTVTLTSYPPRIAGVAAALDTIYSQTIPPSEVLLWLAADQFPQREADLPDALRTLISESRLTVRWCDDLKPHKKYFYAFQEIRNGVIVTVDDDLFYGPQLIENLLLSYVLNPQAVHASRTHLMAVTEDGRLLPYRYWIKETDSLFAVPSMQLFATSGAGTLYPAGVFNPALFDKDVIRQLCLCQDDLWLKAMELVEGVPVVTAERSRQWTVVPDSQAEGLYHSNVEQGENDLAQEKIIRWLDERYGEGFFASRILSSKDNWAREVGIEAYSRHSADFFDRMQQRNRESRNELINEKNARYHELKREFQKLERENLGMKQSLSWRLGQALTWLPRMLKKIFRKT